MASRSAIPCDHELRPGTTVCLRCQHAERGAKRARQRQMIARGGAATLALGAIVAVGIAAVGAWRSRAGSSPGRRASTGAVTAVSAFDSTANADTILGTVGSASVASGSASPSGSPVNNATSAAGIAPASNRVVSPIIPVGRTVLRDTMVAERMGDTVRVSFDLLFSRTRRPEKFEAIMRATLPQVYGAVADTALRSLPEGSVARAGDLIATLPERGIRISMAGGTTIAVWPETRAGRDGPLVVAYRALASR